MSEMNENKTLSCAVVRDLMPLYVEDLTEEETTEMMREHIAGCAACAQSYGMQKTKLEIEKKPQRPDWRGVRFFKKSFLKRVALVLAVLIMGFFIAVGGGNYLFSDRVIADDLIKLVGQYELSDGRIVLAMQAEGYCVNNLEFFTTTYLDGSAYAYSSGYRQVQEKDEVLYNGSASFVTDRFRAMTRKMDARGDIFYYMFDPTAVEDDDGYRPFATVPPTALAPAGEDAAVQEEVETRALQYVRVNSGRIIWRREDPLRKLTAEEEVVLLRAMEKAGALERSVLLPETDIIDTLMGK